MRYVNWILSQLKFRHDTHVCGAGAYWAPIGRVWAARLVDALKWERAPRPGFARRFTDNDGKGWEMVNRGGRLEIMRAPIADAPDA